AGNDTWEGAEALVVAEEDNGITYHFVEGDLINDATDVDHFSIDVPSTIPEGATVVVACNGWQLGSGLRGLQIQLYTDDGDPLSGSKVETAAAGAELDQFPASAYEGMSKAILKVSATSQADGVTGTWYRCGFHMVAPLPESDPQ
ncbi:MAG: hypothetical protein VX938_01000, partial [Myxococcota bacterium]|nr:hypothetical protein [Myxococcota bacterium]